MIEYDRDHAPRLCSLCNKLPIIIPNRGSAVISVSARDAPAFRGFRSL